MKRAFRRLAKVYHPDLNPENRSLRECESLMSELVEAYERLLRNDADADDFLEGFRVGRSNKIALACELYSLDELSVDPFYEVHGLRMEFESFGGDGETHEHAESSNNDTAAAPAGGDGGTTTPGADGRDRPGSLLLPVAPGRITSVKAHPGDSVSDLQSRLESDLGAAWGLCEGGWELVAVRTNEPQPTQTAFGGGDESEEDGRADAESTNEVLSYHLFLDDYHIKHGETIYAVVLKSNNDNGNDN